MNTTIEACAARVEIAETQVGKLPPLQPPAEVADTGRIRIGAGYRLPPAR